MRFCLLVALVILCSSAHSREPDVEAYAKLSQANRASKIEELVTRRNEIDALPAKQKKEHQDELAGILRRLEPLLRPSEPYFSESAPVEVGAIGQFAKVEFEVVDVVDEASVLVQSVSYYRRQEVRRVDGKEYAYQTGPYLKRTGRMFLLKGYPTDKLTSDSNLKLEGVYWIPSNHTYETVDGGTNTVLVAEKFDIEPHKQRFTREHELIEWEVDGKVVQAILLDYLKGKAMLATMDETLEVDLSSLSDDGRKTVRERIIADKQRKAEASAKTKAKSKR